MPVRKRAALCAESVSVGMATNVNGRASARRGDARQSVGVPGVNAERGLSPAGAGAFVCESRRAQAQGEQVHVTQICVNTLSLTFSPLSHHLRLVQRQPPVHVMPERHLSPDGRGR